MSFPTPEQPTQDPQVPPSPTLAPPVYPPVEPPAQPWTGPADGPPLGYPGQVAWPVPPKRRLGREVLVALAVAVVVALLGFPLGALWSAVAPHAPAITVSGCPTGTRCGVYADPEKEYLVAAEGWYVFLTLGAGIVIAALVWAFLRRYRGVPMLLALGLGGAVAGVLTFWTGRMIGRSHADEVLRHATPGTELSLPVTLRVGHYGLWHGWLPYARGDVLFVAVTAVLIYVLLAGFSPYPSLYAPKQQSWVSSDPPNPAPVSSD